MNEPITLQNLNSKAKFRSAERGDIRELVELYRRFYAEAVYKDFLQFDEQRVRATVLGGIATDELPHIVAIVDDRIVGFISWIIDHSFSIEPCQVLRELYVLPAYRRGAIGRALVGLSVIEGRVAGCGAYHAPVASGMVEAKSLFNLFSKAGFQQFGFMMRRGL
jgi:GNAT superfamily N-acetyltransferase